MTATEVDSSPAQDAAATDVIVFIDADDGRSMIACRDGCGEPGDAGADDHHIGRQVPFDLRLRLLGTHSRQRDGADAGCCAFRQESSSADWFPRACTGIAIVGVLAHFVSLPKARLLIRIILTL